MNKVVNKLGKCLLSFILVFLMMSGIIPTELFEMQQASAFPFSKTIHIKQYNTPGVRYDPLGPWFPERLTVEDSLAAYCQAHKKTTPDASITYKYVGDVKTPAVCYILSNGFIQPGEFHNDDVGSWGQSSPSWLLQSYVTQTAFAAYNNDVTINWSAYSGKAYGKVCKKIYDGALACKSVDEIGGGGGKIKIIDVEKKKKATEHDMYLAGDYFRTRELKVEVDGAGTPKVDIQKTDKNKISKVEDKLERKGKITEGFYYRIKASDVNNILNVKITASLSGGGKYYYAKKYEPTSGTNYQPFYVPYEGESSGGDGASVVVKIEGMNLTIKKAGSVSAGGGGASMPKFKFDIYIKGNSNFNPKTISLKAGESKDFKNITPAGKVTIKEHIPEGGFDAPKITVSGTTATYSGFETKFTGKPGKSYTVTYKNGLVETECEIVKRMVTTTYPNYGMRGFSAYEDLSGFEFTLEGTTDLGGEVNRVKYTDSAGNIDFGNIVAGSYTISETDYPSRFYPSDGSGRQSSGSFSFTVPAPEYDEDGNVISEPEPVSHTFYNAPKIGWLKLYKDSEFVGSPKTIANIEFFLFGTPEAYNQTWVQQYADDFRLLPPDDPDNKDLGAMGVHVLRATDLNGVIDYRGISYYDDGILIGNYTLDEVYPGKDKFLYKFIRPHPQSFSIRWDQTTSISFYNKLKRGNLVVKKWAEDSQKQGRRFHLYGTSLEGAYIDEYRYTDANGIARFDNILISGAKHDEYDRKGEHNPGWDNYYYLEEVDVPTRYYVQNYNFERNESACDAMNPVKNKNINRIPVQITFTEETESSDTTYVRSFNMLKRGDIRVVKRCEDDLVVGLTFKLNLRTLAYEQTHLEWIHEGTITDTTMDPVDPVPGDSMRNKRAWQHRYGTLATRNGVEQLRGWYTKTTKLQDVDVNKVWINKVEWTTATIWFRDIPITGSEASWIEEIYTPTRYIQPRNQDARVEWYFTPADQGDQTPGLPVEKIVDLMFLNELKRGSLRIMKTSEDGFIKGMTFKLTGTSLAWHQAEDQLSRNKKTSQPLAGKIRYPYSVFGEPLNEFTYTATTDENGIARFENVLITWDEQAENDKYKYQYVIEEVNTKTRYMVPDVQTTPIIWNESRYYKGVKWDVKHPVYPDYDVEGWAGDVLDAEGNGIGPRWKNNYNLYFYNQLKRGDLEIRKTSEDGFLKDFTFRLTGKALAKIQTDEWHEVQTGDLVPNDISTGVVTPRVNGQEHEALYTIDFFENTNEQGIAKFVDVLASDDAGTLTLSPSYLNRLAKSTTDATQEIVYWLYITRPANAAKQWKQSTQQVMFRIVPSNYNVNLDQNDYNIVLWKLGSSKGLEIPLHDAVTGAIGQVKVEVAVEYKNTQARFRDSITDKNYKEKNRTTLRLGTDYTMEANVDRAIPHSSGDVDAWEYTITEVNTPRRYIVLPKDTAPILWKEVVETYEPYNRSFYNRLKRGVLVIKKTAQTIDENTRLPIDETVDLSGYTFKITATSLASIESGVLTPPQYYGRYGKDIYGNKTSYATEEVPYETEYYATTDKNGIAVFDDILINDYLYYPKNQAQFDYEEFLKNEKNSEHYIIKGDENLNNDIGNYINATVDTDITGQVTDPYKISRFRPLDEDTIGMIYYYEVEEINTDSAFMQPDKQYIQIQWYNDIPYKQPYYPYSRTDNMVPYDPYHPTPGNLEVIVKDGRTRVTAMTDLAYHLVPNSDKARELTVLDFENSLKQFRVVMEKQDIETGEVPRGGATLENAVYSLYYNDLFLADYTTHEASYWIEKDPELADVLSPGHVYIVSDYYVCGDGYKLVEKTPPTGYMLSDEVIYIDAKSERLLAADRYNRLYEQTKYTITGQRDKDGGRAYIAKEVPWMIPLRAIKTALVFQDGSRVEIPEYCVEFKVYSKDTGFMWNEETETPRLTTEDPVLQDPYDPEFDPQFYNMDHDANLRQEILDKQRAISERVRAYNLLQDYLITDVNGQCESAYMPYGQYLLEQITTWKAYTAVPDPIQVLEINDAALQYLYGDDFYKAWNNEEVMKEREILTASRRVENKETFIQNYITEHPEFVDAHPGEDPVVVLRDMLSNEAKRTFAILSNPTTPVYVKVIKTDSDIDGHNTTEKTVNLSGFKFKLWNKATSEYMMLNYRNSTDKDPYVIETDETGMAISELQIDVGDYEIHEIDAPTGFVRRKWENGDVVTIRPGFDADYYNEKGDPVDTMTRVFEDTPLKGQIDLYKKGERMTSIDQSKYYENDKLYTPVYEEIGLKGAVFDVYAVESVSAFPDIPADMRQYAKPIVADYSGNYPRYRDEFGNRLDTQRIPVDTITTGEDGHGLSKPLYNGLYRIVEKIAPEGMLLDETPIYVRVNNTDQETPVSKIKATASDDRQKVRFRVKKSMEQNEKWGIGFDDEVTEVVYGLFAKDKLTAIDGTEIPANGLLSTVKMSSVDRSAGLGEGVFDADVPAGRYYIREIKTHEAYNIDTAIYDVTFEYFLNAQKNGSYTTGRGVTYEVDADGYIELMPVNPLAANNGNTLINTLILGKICGYKVKLGDKSVKIDGALFGLFKEGTTNFNRANAIETCYTKNGGYFEFNDVPYGRWILKEILVPYGYVATRSSQQTVFVQYDEQVLEYDIDNERIVGDIFLKKYDRTSGLSIVNHTYKKAYFTLYIDTNGDGVHTDDEPMYAAGYYTDENGELLIKDVPYGKYVLVESVSPAGYLIDNGNYPVSIEEDGKVYYITNARPEDNVDAANVFFNERQLGTLRIDKYAPPMDNIVLADGTIGQKVDLADITFRIESVLITDPETGEKRYSNPFNAHLVYQANTDANGVAMFVNIPVGRYKVIEMSSKGNKCYDLKPSEGFVEIEYGSNAYNPVIFTVNQTPKKVPIKIIKYAPDGGDISNIVYKISGLINGRNEFLQYVNINPSITKYGEKGKMSTTEVELWVGDYTIEEIYDTSTFIGSAAQTLGYNEMDLSYYNKGNPDYELTVSFTNKLRTLGNLSIVKTGEDPDEFIDKPYTEDTASFVRLPNVSYLVEGDPESEDEDVRNFNMVITTDETGVASLKKLYVGRYYVTELHANTYRIKFKASFIVEDEAIERTFTSYVSPTTSPIPQIKQDIRTQLNAIGITATDDIINDIINGINLFENNPAGTMTQRYSRGDYEYSVELVGSPGNRGYIVDSERKVVDIVYNPDNPEGVYEWSTLQFKNYLETGDVRITKTSEDNQVSGARFLVKGRNKFGVYCEYILTTSDEEEIYDAEKGIYVIASRLMAKLLAGEYTIKEISMLQYNLGSFDEDGNLSENAEKRNVSLTSEKSIYVETDTNNANVVYSYTTDNGIIDINVENTLRRGNLKIVKVAEDRQKGNLAGFLFKVTGVLANGNTYEGYFRTDKNGEIMIENLVVGRYTIEEQIYDEDGNLLSIMYPYVLADAQTVDVVYKETTEVTITNELERGPLKIIKTSDDGKIEGVRFLVEGKQKNGEWFSQIFVTDEFGEINADIVAGEYTVTEIMDSKTPYNHLDPISIVVDEKGYAYVYAYENDISLATPTDPQQATPTDAEELVDDGVVRIAKFHNTDAYGSIMITKTAEDGAKADFEFRIYGYAYNGQFIDIQIYTKADGVAISPKLPVGEYTVSEINGDASIKYVLPASKKVIVLENDLVNVDFYNRIIRGSLRVLKIGSDKKKLANAEFTLYYEDKQVYDTFTTDENGEGGLSDIPYGIYLMRETKAPNNYMINSNVYRVNIDKEGVVKTFTVIDKKIPDRPYDDTPYTGYDEAAERRELEAKARAEAEARAKAEATPIAKYANLPAVRTGDTTNYIAYVTVMVISLGIIFVAKKRRRTE